MSGPTSGGPAGWHDGSRGGVRKRVDAAAGRAILSVMPGLATDLPATDDPALLAAALSVTRLDTVWADDPRLDTGPGLEARIRGAWGQHLRALARADPEAGAARAAFFPDKTDAPTAGAAAPPYRITAARSPGGLSVTLALIGFAGHWRRPAFDALIAALAGPPGLRLAARAAGSARLRLLAADWARTEGVPVPPPPALATLEFATPLRIGPEGALGTRFGDVIVGLAERGAALAPWTGLRFAGRPGHWREVTKTLRFDASGLRPVVWDSFSSMNGHEAAAGYLGCLTIGWLDAPTTALLAAGTALHAGADVAKGCGRYTLESR